MYAQGIQLLEQGNRLAQRNQDRQALQSYQQGIHTLIKVLRNAPASTQQTIRALLHTYLGKAEALKAKLEPGFRAVPPRANVPKALREQIEQQILSSPTNTVLEDVVGLSHVKQCLYECVVLPSLNPRLFTGLRAPPKGLLLFGPPGNGKTLIAKALAGSCKATFFAVSAASLTSKYVGEAEKLVKALFAVAREKAPAIIFLDEVDSVLSARSAQDNEASTRLKTEFLVAFDGVSGVGQDEQVLVLAATNLPQALDPAVLRRFPRRVHVPLPDAEVRYALFRKLLVEGARAQLGPDELQLVVERSHGYSASDIRNVCREAAMGPVREMDVRQLARVTSEEQLGRIRVRHVLEALSGVSRTVSDKSSKALLEWDAQFGTSVSGPAGSGLGAALGDCCIS